MAKIKCPLSLLKDLALCLTTIPDIDYQKNFNITYPNSCTQEDFVQLIAEQLKLPIEKIALNQFEKAIIEAFESNISLATLYCDFDSILKKKQTEISFKKGIRLYS